MMRQCKDWMNYDYQSEKHKVFLEENQKNFLKVRDNVKELLDTAGAFKITAAWKGVDGDSCLLLAFVDRLVELGEVKELIRIHCDRQERVFTSP